MLMTPYLRRFSLTTAAVAVLLLLVAPAAAQQPAPEAEPAADEPIGEFSERMAVSWVLVPVLVYDQQDYVNDLPASAFRLFVDDEPVEIAGFESGASAPVSLVFLQDLSGSMANGDKLESSRRALAWLLSRARPDDEFALASFAGERLRVEVPFTREEQVLAEAMGLWEAYGTTAIHDAVAWIPEIAVEGRHPKRAAVLLTDGVDNASDLSPEAARRVVVDARLPVYVLGLGRRRRAGADPADDSYGRLLQELARTTGGRYFAVRPGDAVSRAAADMLEELRKQYVLAFPIAAGSAGSRRLRVEVEAPGRLTVYHRKGYRGGPPV